jgi:tRNA dimethylallyltransferase
MKADMILILGVTGSGKGRLAFDLAKDLGAEIISIDSMKVYRRMDIGTAKPPKEARAQVKYHLIDIMEPSDSFSVRSFLDNALEAIRQIRSRNKPVVAVGGTALYIKALLYGLFEGPAANKQIRAELRARAETGGLEQLYRQLTQVDPEAAARIHQNDARRIIRALEVYELTGKPISSFQRQWNPQQTSDERRATNYDWTIIGLRRDKAEENKRINARVKKMIAAGLVDEVKSLLSEEEPLSPQARCAIGYAEVIDYLSGKTTLEDAIELIKKSTRRLAKSQRTWFKTFRNVHWLNIGPEEPGEKILDRVKGTVDSIGSR